MCTVSWNRREDGYDLFFNRDERRSRAQALPPTLRDGLRGRFLAPTDPEFGGTWLATNDRGVTVGLLNGYRAEDETPARPFTSRGLLVDRLAGSPSVDDLRDQLADLELTSFRSFVILALDPERELQASWHDGQLTLGPAGEESGLLISSSFRPAEVTASRRQVFEEATLDGTSVENLLRFHAGHRPERGAHSVCMHRPDARTVSFSWIGVGREETRFTYLAGAPHQGLEGAVVSTLPRR